MALHERSQTATLASVLAVRATSTPEAPFLVHGDRLWSYGRVDSDAEALAAALRDLARAAGVDDRLHVTTTTDRLSYRLGDTARDISPDTATDDIVHTLLDDIAAALPADRHLAFLDHDQQVAVFCLSEPGHTLIDTAAPGLLLRTPPL